MVGVDCWNWVLGIELCPLYTVSKWGRWNTAMSEPRLKLNPQETYCEAGLATFLGFAGSTAEQYERVSKPT